MYEDYIMSDTSLRHEYADDTHSEAREATGAGCSNRSL